MVDRYTKVVLTMIAAALIWLCLWGPGPKWGTPAIAQSGPVAVNVAEVGGKRVSTFSPAIPVTVEDPVTVKGTVEVEGSLGGYPVAVKVR